MNLSEKMVQASKKMIQVKEEIIEEIYSSFAKTFNSGALEEALEKRISNNKELLLNREYSLNVEFWQYTAGCSDTNFRVFTFTWTNPDGTGYDSTRYKGIELYSISNEICQKLMNLTQDKLEEMGFKIMFVTNNQNNLGYYDKKITFCW